MNSPRSYKAAELRSTPYTRNCCDNIWTRLSARRVSSRPYEAVHDKSEKGAETIVYLASSSDAQSLSGEYLEKLRVKEVSEESYDEEIAQRLGRQRKN